MYGTCKLSEAGKQGSAYAWGRPAGEDTGGLPNGVAVRAAVVFVS